MILQRFFALAINIIRNNDKLSPEAAFDEISKILFMKIKYEREQRGAKVFTEKSL